MKWRRRNALKVGRGHDLGVGLVTHAGSSRDPAGSRQTQRGVVATRCGSGDPQLAETLQGQGLGSGHNLL